MTKKYDLIVFDWDGTLMDSTAVIVRSMQAACRDLDLPVPTDAAARYVIGMGLDDALRRAVPDAPPNLHAPLADRYRHHYLAQDAAIPLFEGALETILSLHESGRLLAVATGKSRRGLDRALAATGLTAYFHATRTADETFSKPHPAMLQEIMDELDVPASRALMVGDTTHDLLMAQNAGVDALGFTHGAHQADELLAAKPLALLDDFCSLCAWLQQHA